MTTVSTPLLPLQLFSLALNVRRVCPRHLEYSCFDGVAIGALKIVETMSPRRRRIFDMSLLQSLIDLIQMPCALRGQELELRRNSSRNLKKKRKRRAPGANASWH